MPIFTMCSPERWVFSIIRSNSMTRKIQEHKLGMLLRYLGEVEQLPLTRQSKSRFRSDGASGIADLPPVASKEHRWVRFLGCKLVNRPILCCASGAVHMPRRTGFIHHYHNFQVDLICLKCNALVASAKSIRELKASRKDHVCRHERNLVKQPA